MAVAALPFARLSLVETSNPSAVSSPWKSTSRSIRSSDSFAITPLTHVSSKGFSFSQVTRRPLIVVAAAPPKKKKVDSAIKRARQAEKRRTYNKARKSEIHTRMKKVFVAIEGLRKEASPSVEMLTPIEALIGEAFSTIDKAVKVGTLHQNTGARRKSRLSRAKRTVEIQLGWYTPSTAAAV
ncbi:hypothetical protein KP509_11G009600 [Ceratopteris richardii]|uniref:30S ribosomal protein S20, chloroplastic n=1 Tax=Ceratopteris richardii TaxID=49495 RepID=A0A8T2TSQ0_CERRI|nr:hypothetical protein KP509_11G009600 [Ceratopteris richardii]